MGKMKRWLAALLMLAIIPAAGRSFASGNSYIQCDCFFGRCTCFIQLGDEGGAVKGIFEALIEKKYLPKGTPKGLFTEDVETAVKEFQADHDLETTGTMDDDTLTLLLWDMLPEQLDKLDGGTSATCRTVFLPTDGGKKRHLKETCSKMKDPRKVSDRNGEKLGFGPCGRCYK